ncbi:MAG TPA: Gfo/Idh/MocA family oxidoreductase [Roseiflexaceae bacterium]|nr:Gfo/Idh/MocA family oxidoreductase [Roseiflexaceae bacterium]
MSKLRIGIIGAGGIARGRHIPCFQRNPHATVAALADVVVDAAQSVAAEHGIPAVYADYREMLEQEPLDAVVVCTPNKFHAPATIAALQRGLHVLCEKPMALDPAEAREMLAAAEQAGKILSIAFHYRHMANVRAARRVVESGELGQVYMVRVQALRRRGIPSWGSFVHKDIQGGGALIDFGVHLLDSALWLMGNPRPVEVCASLSQHLGKRPNVNPWGQWNYKEFTVEDQVAAFVRFDNGATMLLECSWALNIPESRENISLSGTEAGLEVFPLTVNKAAHEMLLSYKADWMPGEKENPGDVQTADFVDAIREGRQPISRAEQALQVTEIVDAIYRSAEAGRALRLDG